ncbi:MAG: efflux RND transporter permease subunit, partial [Anaerolineae bacterium]
MTLFIRRPVATALVMIAVLLFGAMSYRSIPVSDLPNVDFPTILVTASYPGSNPETMAAAVATPLEKQFSTIAGLDSMTSTSSLGLTQITLQFALDRSIDAAAQDVQAAISAVAQALPRDMPNPPSFQKVNPSDMPVIYIALTSPTLPTYRLDEYGETLLAQRLSTLPGVAQVMVYGAQKYAVRVQLNPKALARRQIGLDQVVTAVQEANPNLPTGTLWGKATAPNIQVNGQLNNAAAFRPVIVTYRNGAPVRLRDVGRVIDSVETSRTASWYIDQRAVVLAVQRQPGSNTVAVASAVRALLPTFRHQLPASVSLHVLFDRSAAIKASVRDVQFTLVLTLVLVVLVIFAFLRNVSATIIPSLALPLSVVGTFAVMNLLHFSLDNLSLMALTLSLGFVVDDAVVMLENIVRHMEMGKPPYQAAVDGAKEISFTIVSMTLSLAAVFLPLLFLGGIIGRLFFEFAVTITVAILISGFVSLSLTPMMCSRFLRPTAQQRHGRLYRASEAVFQGVLHAYERSLALVMRHRL